MSEEKRSSFGSQVAGHTAGITLELAVRITYELVVGSLIHKVVSAKREHDEAVMAAIRKI